MALLTGIPAELLSRIASHLFSSGHLKDKFKDDGFCNLRLSCRALELKTRFIFERAAFSSRRVTLRACSLLRLRDISHHPHFGKLIKKLVFVKAKHPVYDVETIPLGPEGPYRFHQYAQYGVIELPKHGSDGVYPNRSFTLRNRVQLGLQGCLDAIMAHTPNLKHVVIKENFMACFWLDSPSRQEQLNQQAQCRYQSNVNSDSEPDSVDKENEDYDNDDVDDPNSIEAHVYSDHLLYLVMRAAQRNGIRLSSLNSTNTASSAIRARTFVEVASALHDLKHLDIGLSASNPTKLRRMDGTALYGLEGARPVAKSLGHAINSLRDLQSLELAFDDLYWEENRHISVSQSLRGLGDRPFKHLSSVGIRDVAFEGSDLFNFVKQQKSTIRRLLLSYITLPNVEDWRLLLAMVLESLLLLTELECTYLSYGITHFDHEKSLRCCTIERSERQDVPDDLKRVLASFPEHSE